MDDKRKKLAEALGEARRYQRLAVRWLIDANRFKINFGQAEAWNHNDLGETAELIYNDAVREVKRVAKEVEKRYSKLEKYDGRNI